MKILTGSISQGGIGAETGRVYSFKPGSTSGRADSATLHGYLHGNDSLCGCGLHTERLAGGGRC